MVDNLEAEVPELRLVDDVLDYGAVLDFADADYGGSVGCGAGLELADGVCEIVDLDVVFAAVPLTAAAGSEFQVAAFGIVGNRIEQILKVIEGDTGNLHLAVAVVLGAGA